MEDYPKLAEAIKHFPCLWKPFHKDYNNQKAHDQAWTDVTKRYNSARLSDYGGVVNWCSPEMVENVKRAWQAAIRKDFVDHLDLRSYNDVFPKSADFDRMRFLMCGLSTGFYKRYGYAEMSHRWREKPHENNVKKKKSIQGTLFNFAEELMKKDAEEKASREADYKNKLVKGTMEKAVMVNLVKLNPWLWDKNNVMYKNVGKCEEAWKSISKQLSESDDYYYVWKYQRMWQALVQRFLVQFQEKKKLCSHFEQIKEFLIIPALARENQILYIKKVQELSIHFVKVTNEKLAKENKRYELRPDVIQGYSKIINLKETPNKKLEESENAPYFAAMQELLKKR